MDYSTGELVYTLASATSLIAGDKVNVIGTISKRYEYDYKDIGLMNGMSPFCDANADKFFDHDVGLI